MYWSHKYGRYDEFTGYINISSINVNNKLTGTVLIKKYTEFLKYVVYLLEYKTDWVSIYMNKGMMNTNVTPYGIYTINS